MAFPTSVNDEITDAVTQSNVRVIGEAPAQAMGMVYQATGLALGLAAQNAVAQQRDVEVVALTTTNQSVARLLGGAP